MTTTPTTEDRIWAVISHLSVLAFGMGIVLPIIGWSDQRRKSNYASFQSLQALGYQSLGFTVWILLYLLILIFASILLLAILGSKRANIENIDANLTPGMIVILIVIFGFFVLYILLPMIAAVACALGRDFRYPIMGNQLARYLDYDSPQKSEEQIWLNEDHEFRWVAAMGHFSILIIIWGMLAPLTALILFGKRSFFLKFQSIQTLAYQAGVTLLFLGGGLISALGSIVSPVIVWSIFSSDPNSPMGIVGLVIIFAFILVPIIMILLIVPLFHILGQWAGYRVLKGDDYHYPWIGKFIHKRLLKEIET